MLHPEARSIAPSTWRTPSRGFGREPGLPQRGHGFQPSVAVTQERLRWVADPPCPSTLKALRPSTNRGRISKLLCKACYTLRTSDAPRLFCIQAEFALDRVTLCAIIVPIVNNSITINPRHECHGHRPAGASGLPAPMARFNPNPPAVAGASSPTKSQATKGQIKPCHHPRSQRQETVVEPATASSPSPVKPSKTKR